MISYLAYVLQETFKFPVYNLRYLLRRFIQRPIIRVVDRITCWARQARVGQLMTYAEYQEQRIWVEAAYKARKGIRK